MKKDKFLSSAVLQSILLFVSMISFPSFSAVSFTLLEYNLAFSLGISLPLIIIAFLIRVKINNSWWYPIVLLISLLLFLAQLRELQDVSLTYYYSSAALYITLLTLIPRSGVFQQDAKVPLVVWCNYLTVIFLSLGVASWFFLSHVSVQITWLIFAVALLVCAIVRFTQANKYHRQDRLRFNLLLIFIIANAAVVYLYQYLMLDVHWLLVSVGLSYLIALLNFSWLLTAGVKASVIKDVEDELTPQISALNLLGRDVVTNLPTQVSALKIFSEHLKRQQNYRYAVIIFKPINFVKVNQLLGQHNSDLLLLQLAYCLQKRMAEQTSLFTFVHEDEPIKLARLQSLQFLVLLDVSNNEYAAEHYVQEICQLLSSSVPEAASFKSFSLNFELTFGIDYFDHNSASITEVVASAGDAMLHAQQLQKKLVYFDHQVNKITEQQLVQMELLKTALVEQKIECKIQPQVNLITKQVIAYEMQLFWLNEQHDIVELKDFIDIAENSGELFSISKIMIQQACRHIAFTQTDKITPPIEIKILSEQQLDETLINFITEQIRVNNIAAANLLIIIPESLLLLAKEKIRDFLSQLNNVGLGIVIDDFSGGYEALRLLRKLAIKKVKIDCASLASQHEAEVEKLIVNALVNLADVMHIPLIGKNINSLSIEQAYLEVGGVNGQGNRIAPAQKFLTQIP